MSMAGTHNPLASPYTHSLAAADGLHLRLTCLVVCLGTQFVPPIYPSEPRLTFAASLQGIDYTDALKKELVAQVRTTKKESS